MDYSYNNQYSTTSYGAQGGANGGGFMPHSGSQDDSGGGTKRGFGKDTVRPVTIKQIIDAQQSNADAEFTIDNVEISQLTFVAQIRNISTQATNTTYKLDDGTGTIEAKLWNNDSGDSTAMETDSDSSKTLSENAYARVWGRLKAFNDRRHVAALFVRPVSDLNEVQYHLLDATVAHLHFTRGPLGEAGGATNGEAKEGANGEQNGDMAGSTRRVLPAGLSGTAKKVYQVLHTTPQTNEGLHMQDVAVRAGMDMSEVGKAGDELLGQGLIYTTVDDQTWAILDEL